MSEVTDRNKVREQIAKGGWTLVWGDLINEFDIIQLIVSIPTGTVSVWVSQQINAQLEKFRQSLSDVSDDVVNQAANYLKSLLDGKVSGERDINGLGIKAGIATYHRSFKTPIGSTKLPNNHQPYIGLRVTKPLPPKGTPATVTPGLKFSTFIEHTGTALHETDETFAFAMTDWNGDGHPDLVAIKKSKTGTNRTEVHILSGASKFRTFLLQTGTALQETDETFDFAMADYNGDGRPDLVAIKKSKTGTNSTEIHILSGASNFSTFIEHTGTALHETDETFDFAMADYNGDGHPDLVAIKKSKTGSNSTEIHILSGASKFSSFIEHTGTALHETDETFDFTMTDYNQDGHADLVAIKKSNTGTNSTEVHILSGASKFSSFIEHTGTVLHETDKTFAFAMADYDGNGQADLVAIKKSKTGTNSTEIHILAA